MAQWHPEHDPYAAREAQRYERPIPSREYIIELLTKHGAPLSFDELVQSLGMVRAQDLDALTRRLGAMKRDGQLIRNRRGEYGVLAKMDLVRGRISAHRDGYGFLIPEDGSEDLYLAPRQMHALLHGDRIVARVVGVDRRGRKEAALVDVLERGTKQVAGRFFRERGIGYVVPNNKRIHQDVLVPADMVGEAEDGQIVVCDIVAQPSHRGQPIGRVVDVLGEHMAPGMEIELAIRSHELPRKFPKAVQEEISGLNEVPAGTEIEQGRTDLRAAPLVTIDGPDAQDFDDAVYCERTAKGWKLIVAIADVAAYVRPGTALDEEARLRGTSVYFPGRVIPMLPKVLSNGLCSLKPSQERLCIACELIINADGRTMRSRFFAAVMRSQARLTYDQVNEMVVARDAAMRSAYGSLVGPLDELYALYRVLRQTRDRRGGIDIDVSESRIVFGAGRKIARIEPLVRNDAHRMIEESMVAANVAAARFLQRQRIGLLYRVHDSPPPAKLTDLRAFLAELGYQLAGGERPQGKHFGELLGRVNGEPEAHLVQTVLVRSLAQAVYSPENIGHFGLGLDCYAHFTSPIRRYPDLVVHRAIRHVLNGGSANDFALGSLPLDVLGDHCSMTERRADEATRDATDWLKCEFMLDKVGEVFTGLISGTSSFGLFVELDDIYVVGLVHVTALGNDYFHFDPVHHRLQGERTGMSYRLGDRIRIRVVRVDLDERRLDFELASRPASGARRRRGRRWP
jgi:ribonuclease R